MRRQIDALMSSAIFAILGLISFIIISRGVESNVFGTWMLFLSVSTFIDLIRFGLTRNATIRMIAGEEYHKSHIVNAAGLRLGIKILAVLSILSISLWMVGSVVFNEAYNLILFWYPLVGLSNLLWNNGLTWLQAQGKFRHITLLRFVNISSFIVIVLVLLHYKMAVIEHIILAYIASNFISSILSLFKGWDSLSYSFGAAKRFEKQILDFGKYSTLSNIGSSLLKSADSFIIGLSPVLGMDGIAIYSIPFKIVEMMELPIRSVAMVGFNEFSNAVRNKMQTLRQLTARYVILMSGLTLPVILIIAFFPHMILNILGGTRYIVHYPQMTVMIYLLLVYGIMLIPDRLTGIILEAIGRPQMNTVKVSCMAVANIVGDMVAVFYFKSLVGVIFATVFFVVVGVLIGYFMVPSTIRPLRADFQAEFRKLPKLWHLIWSKKEI